MRMERLLADLEAAEAARAQAQARLDVAEGVRAERASVVLADRLRAAENVEISVIAAGAQVRGRVRDVGIGWVVLDRGLDPAPSLGVEDLVRPGMQAVALEAIDTVTGLPRTFRPDDAPAVGRTWGSLFRAAARSRVPVAVRTRFGLSESGVVGAVSADHLVMRRRAGDDLLVTFAALAHVDLCAGRADQR